MILAGVVVNDYIARAFREGLEARAPSFHQPLAASRECPYGAGDPRRRAWHAGAAVAEAEHSWPAYATKIAAAA